MKVWSDVSTVVKIALYSFLIGFVLGLCMSGLVLLPSELPAEPSATVELAQ